MNYQIALDPRLDFSPAEFVAAWNETPACLAVGKAEQSAAIGKDFDPLLTAALVTVVSSVLVNIASSIFYDLIKETLARKGVTKRTEIIEVTQLDDTRLVVVKIEE